VRGGCAVLAAASAAAPTRRRRRRQCTRRRRRQGAAAVCVCLSVLSFLFVCFFAGHVESFLYQFGVFSRYVITMRLAEHPKHVD